MAHSNTTNNKRRRTEACVPAPAQPDFINQIKHSEDDSVNYWKRKYFQMLRTCGELRVILKDRDFQLDKYRDLLGFPPQVKVGYVSPNAANLEQNWHWRKQENVSDDDVSMNANPDSEVNSDTDNDDDEHTKSDLVDAGKVEATFSIVEKTQASAQIGNDVVQPSQARKSGRIRKPTVKNGKAVTRKFQGLNNGLKRNSRSTNKNKLKSISKNNSSSSAAVTKTPSLPQLQFTCKICSREFSNEMSLENHGKFHLPERKFVCNVCHQRFKEKLHMQVHLRRHTGVKPYNCKQCKKEFTQMANMVYHIRNHHPGKVRK